MTTRLQLIAEAREWIGTRWHHQASLKGVGCDCIGLIRGAAKNIGLITDVEERPELVKFHNYGRAAHDGRLQAAFDAMLGQSFSYELAQPGDVLMLSFNGAPQHVGLLTMMGTGAPGILHAYVPARSVVESHLDIAFRNMIVGCYSIPGIDL